MKRFSWKKVLSVCVTVLMLAGLLATSAVGVSAAPASYTDIEAGETLRVALTLSQSVKYLRFCPTEDGEYSLYSTGFMDTCGVLMDAEEDVLFSDDDSGDESNFAITGYLYAGNVYYLGLSIYNNGTGIFDVTVEKVTSGGDIEADEELSLDGYITATDVPEDEAGIFSFVPDWDGWYTFYTTGDADTYCELWDCNGDWIIFNDNTPDEENCTVTYYLYAGEIYYLVVWGYGSATVDYDLYVEEAFAYNLFPNAYEIVEGETWTCTAMTDADHLYFCFIPEVSGRYHLYSAGDADPYCYFYDVNYGSIDYFDDGDGLGLNFDFSYSLDAGTPYYFMLGDWDAATSFTIMMEMMYEEADDPEYIAIGTGETLTFDDGAPYHDFVFVPETDGWYVFTSSGSCDTAIVIEDYASVRNDNDGAGENFRAVTYCYANEEYSFYTMLYDEDGGTYAVSVNAVDEKDLFPDAEGIKAGDSVAVHGNAQSGSAIYRFVPAVSGVYSLYTTGEMDTYGYLYDLKYDAVEFYDDYYYNGDYNCAFSYRFTAGETYYFVLAAYEEGSVAFEVHLQSGEFDALRADVIALDDTQTVYPDDDGEYCYHAFLPTESGWYRFNMEVDGYLSCQLRDADGFTLNEVDNGSAADDFDLIHYCEAGEVYYIGLSADAEVSSYTVTVTKADGNRLFPEAESIAPDQTKTVYEEQYYRFVPAVSGVYAFASSGDSDANCTLYDVTGGIIEYYDDIDYEAGDCNFGFTYYFVAGQVYYFCTSFYDTYQENEPYTVTLAFNDEITVVDRIDITGLYVPEEGGTVYDYYNDLAGLATAPSLILNDVAVFRNDQMMGESDVFEAGETYLVGIALNEAENDVIFADGCAVTVNIGTVEAVEFVDGYMVIWVAFTIPADEPDVLLGDVDGNGRINNRDLGFVQQYLNDWGNEIDLLAADLDGNGRINNRDMGLLQQLLNQ